jgi:dynein heavy chain
MSDDEGESTVFDTPVAKYVLEKVFATYPKHVKGAKFDKAFQNEENSAVLEAFISNETSCLLIPESLKLSGSNAMPNKLPKTKSICLSRTVAEFDEKAPAAGQVMLTELASTPFEHLELLSNEVFLPVLSNQLNQQRWGEVATKEIMDRFYSFLSSTTILCGQIKGETRLPMPPLDVSGAGSGKNRISLLEGAIITWTKQIKNVLKQDPESQLKMGYHPTPDVEISFWKNKANNLNSIFEQLQGQRIRRVLRALDQQHSTYCATFARLCKDVFTARLEANDNMKYLRTLEEWFDKLNNEDNFPALLELFKPMLHIILLIWKNSKHYNTPARLVVLMREICNSLINQACKYVSGEQIFSLIEAEEAHVAVEQLKTTLLVCGTFKSTYFDYKATANAECPANPWRIQNNALFMRLDSFLERCHDILDLTQTIVQFSKLAKIEVGGTKGKTLTTSVQQIHGDFQSAVDKFKGVDYDIMDVSAKQFDDDFYEFRCSIKELERRLGAVVSLAFDDCATVYGRFKLLDSFEGLLERPIIQDELEKKYVGLVQAYGADLKNVQELFLEFRDKPPSETARNLPPITGSLTWCRGLVSRIQTPMVKLQLLDRTILDREEAKEVAKVHATIMASLQEYETQKIEEWGRDVEASSDAKLKLPLVQRNPDTRLITTNFDPALVRLLREVKYFLLLGLSVPESALEIYKSVETFRAWTGNLDLIVNMNNNVLNQLLPVEKPLVAPYLTKFDNAVEAGISNLNWRSGGVDEFIEGSMVEVRNVHEVLKTMKDNFSNVENLMSKWDKPLVERKVKPVEKDELERMAKALRTSRFAEVKESGKAIQNLMKETNKILRVSNASPDWRSYVDFVNNVVIDGLSTAITTSLEFLLDQIDPEVIAAKEKLPLLELKIQLEGDGVNFSPPLGHANGKGVADMIDQLVGSFLQISTQFKRLDTEGTYMREMHTDIDVNNYMAMLTETLAENADKCMELKASFESYSYLWTTDQDTYFAEFCEDAKIVTEAGTVLLDLEKFDAEIKRYEAVQKDVKTFKSPSDIGWLRVNITPVKEKLYSYAENWIKLFTAHMMTSTTSNMENLHNFMNVVTDGLDTEVPEKSEDNVALMEVMAHIRDVRIKNDYVSDILQPQKDAVSLLKKHGYDVNGVNVAGRDLQDYLEEVKMSWEMVYKKMFKKKEDILPMQLSAVDTLKASLEEFYGSLRDFRGDFRANAPFRFQGDAADAYKNMDEYSVKVKEFAAKVIFFNEKEELFDLQQSKYIEIGETNNEIKHLKAVWDFKDMLAAVYADWKTGLWSEVNTEALEDENKKILKQLRAKGAEYPTAKGWVVFQDITDSIKTMGIILPLINDLHSNAMRPRHWAALARVCNVKVVDPTEKTFTLNDMMELNIHEHVEDVSEIVETAQKELKIEKKLLEIEGVWKDMVLDYAPHKETEMFVPRPSEEVVEGIEAHQMELQGIFGMGKFMDYFKDRVMLWQSTLGNVDDTLRMWLNVSKSWASLESIFLASADIRSQLPDDTKRFESINSEFVELMKEAVNEANCVAVCNVEGRYASLKGMLQKLDMCQKSLNEYLDIKKKIFPRFYFVSSVALLDMLANGTNPPKVMPYLGDCYDALANLNFITLESGEKSDKVTDTMIAKDGERVPLHAPFEMSGEVEGYLNQLTEAMIISLKTILDKATAEAVNWEVETPRHEWLFGYPAQLCITGTQIYWTEETQLALDEYEGGQEDATKRYLQTCNTRLNALINLVLGELKKDDRVKIISLITMDVHSRDVVEKLVVNKVEGPAAFMWQQQLRFQWDQATMDVNINICDFACKYFYEWVGNTGRLVITPLTDRCYITLTMGLKLFLGGAPAGPAGTGKTETTKDLARALAIPCYVFNCSDQMNFQSMADIFRGLAQTGAWGCFDEFNRIPIEVLSVVATQVKTIQDAIVTFSVKENREPQYQHFASGTPPNKVGYFDFMGDVISLIPTCGFWITMNPGYAGRTELPENLKALFRSCAMIRPDMKLIQENMLMAEGFQTARALSVKFNTLYDLSAALLSKQPHYDWGLRSVKSVLRVAGTMKRANPDLDEAQVLMRALRDFNTPKIPIHDTPIFLRLISDLFMGLTVESKVDDSLKAKIITVAKATGLQYDEMFVNKTCNFQELLDVRHSVMLLGPTGCAKTTIWKTLQACWNLDKPKKVCVAETVNPKSVTGDELYGYMTLAKDWKDGVLSIIMRGMSKNFPDQNFHDYQTYKWVVLDGDIDAVWIESMNTVMDDNKVLTLVSNERVPLSAAMRMVFEINSLKNATPATVSRAGILFINESDIGWRPFMETWVQQRTNQTEKNYLPGLFDKYVDTLVEMTRKGYKEVTSIRLINKVATIIYLLEGLLPTIPEDKISQETLENFFAFSAMWAFGGPMVVDKSGDYRKKFSEDFAAAFGQKFPKEGECFDYFYDVEKADHSAWSTVVAPYIPVNIGNNPGQVPFNSLFVETVETVRMTFLLNTLVRNGKFAMFVGNAGTGKTGIIQNYLNSLDKDADGIISKYVSMSYFSSSYSLQLELEGYIDKRSGRSFGPPMGKKMVFFIDDMNLPYVETYGTQNSIAFLTQQMQHGSVFDRVDLGFRKELVDIQYLAAMNPTAGSFEICERCQRHFATFAIAMPSKTDLTTIFVSIFGGHLNSFGTQMQEYADKIVDAAINIHTQVNSRFLPSAIKFMYNWNMRELSNIFQGCCMAKSDYFIKPTMLVRLFIHETVRVFADRLVSEPEIDIFMDMFKEVNKKAIGTIPVDEQFEEPIIFTNFVTTTDGSYLPIPSIDKLRNVLDAKLLEYNESNAMMDLVLFNAAMFHITRIARVIQSPGGNAMLIGVGGSGKQSLCKLAAFIENYEIKQLAVTSKFKVEDLKEELRLMYTACGVKGTQMVFLLTDSQIVNEQFLVYINGILNSGWLPDLFMKEDIDNILGSLGSEAKANGIPDTPEARIAFFISRIKANLHIVLAFSPVGDTFRVRARRFPGLVNATVIDQFHPWPRDALISVAARFIEDVDLGSESIKESLAIHMAEEHLSVDRMSKFYLETQRRYNYVTPKSYLELISFYKYLLSIKRSEVQKNIDRLDIGLSTLRKTATDVAELQKDLVITMEKVAEKKAATDVLIAEMGVQQEDANQKKEEAGKTAAMADEESAKAAVIEKDADEELKQAQPAMEQAQAAVDCLSKAMLGELKNLANPPKGVDMVTNCCLILVQKSYNKKKWTWKEAKGMMSNVDAFLTILKNFDGGAITDQEIGLLNEYIENPEFAYDNMVKKSVAAANLCMWVTSIYKYNRIYVKVKPLMDSLNEARAKKAEAEASLQEANDIVAGVEALLAELEEKFQAAVAEKQEVEDYANGLLTREDLAKRLVGGLASENVRWGNDIEKLKQTALTLTGDCMLAAGFVSYVGAFDKELRDELWMKTWTVDLADRKIPMTEGTDPLDMLTDDKRTSQMISEGLPSDRISIENGSIISNCKRWPLIIDPQTQGIKWLREKEKNDLVVIQLTQKKWLKTIETAIVNGQAVIIENLGSEIDATLDPVLSRAIYKKGRNLCMKLAGEEIDYDQAFTLYLQTKLSNPHYKPEIAAQCTLINFIATERGLEDQLLAKVVSKERPDLQAKAMELSSAAVQYQIQLVQLEDDLLEKLANAPEDILSDVPLIEGLEATKKTSTEINEAVAKGEITKKEVDLARESYRPQASEGAMLYFLLTKLCSIDHMYQYSLDSYVTFFFKSIDKAPAADDLAKRVHNLRESLRMTIFTWVARGLFERHKLIFLSQLTFNLMKRGIIGEQEWNEVHFQFLLRNPMKLTEENPLDWLPTNAWNSTMALCELDDFAKLGTDLVEAAPRFREWFNSLIPENEKLPLDWAGLDRNPFQKMLVVRCLRPDRVQTALSNFIRATLPNGNDYADCDGTLNSLEILDQSLSDSTPTTPIYFILSPGANVVADLDQMATKYGFVKGESYHNVSMGQGQDIIAMGYLETAHRNGHWVILNNVHLMPKWLIELEKKLDEYAMEGSHEKFRVFLTSDPNNQIPIGILNRCIKLTNEPPAGLKANLKRAWCFFPKEQIEEADSKQKSILFGLCHFHSIMMERKLFGPMGFNMVYPFAMGDLRDSAKCLANYMDNSGGGKIPWQDLKYIFGEIMYGGHIVNDFDRLMANAYLDFYMKDELLDETEMYPFAEDEKGVSFMSPAATTFEKYIEHIDTAMGPDTPIAFGLHPNAEIDFRTTSSNIMFKTLLELQPREAAGSGEGVATPQQIAEGIAQTLLEQFGEKMFDTEDLIRGLEEQGPYQNVFIQEMDVMNALLAEMKRTIKELQLGFAGELTMSEKMESLMDSLYMDTIPAGWAKKSWPSKRALASWSNNFMDRLSQLDEWQGNPAEIPKVTWLAGLVNPMSFLTSICQVAANKNQWELDKLVTFTDVTKKMTADETDGSSRDGAYIIGMQMQGARWDFAASQIEKSMPKEMFSPMPVMNVKAVTKEKADVQGIYMCPVYITEQRGPTYVFQAQLKTKSPPARWILAGVALIMDIA